VSRYRNVLHLAWRFFRMRRPSRARLRASSMLAVVLLAAAGWGLAAADADTPGVAASWGWTHADAVTWSQLVKTHVGCYLADQMIESAPTRSSEEKRSQLPQFAGAIAICINDMLKRAPSVNSKDPRVLAQFIHRLATPRKLLAATCATIRQEQKRMPQACSHWYAKPPSADE
jgi:hypothetical protein